jgi:carboxypeptidase T
VQLLTAPLGLDVWEVKPDHVVLQATEAQIERLEQMGYGVEQLHMTETYVSTFARAAAADGYHSATELEQDMRALAEQRPDIAELREIGRSFENRPIWALRLGDRRGTDRKVLFLGCHHAREWIAVEVPYLLAQHVVATADHDPVQRWLSYGEIWVAPMINPDGHEFTRAENRLWRKNPTETTATCGGRWMSAHQVTCRRMRRMSGRVRSLSLKCGRSGTSWRSNCSQVY